MTLPGAALTSSRALGFSASVSFVDHVLRWTHTAVAYQAMLESVVTVALVTVLAGEISGPGVFLGALIAGLGVYIGGLADTRRPAPMPASTAAE